MESWIPAILIENIDTDEMDTEYNECVCPQCHETTVHHIGAPCLHYSCPKCGTKMERRGTHEKPMKEGKSMKTMMKTMMKDKSMKEGGTVYKKGGVTILPDGSAFSVGTVKTKKYIKKRKTIKKESLDTKLYENEYAEHELNSYLEFLFQLETKNKIQEDYLGALKKVGQRIKQFAGKRAKPTGPDSSAHRAYWSTQPGAKIPWPSQTAKGMMSEPR